MGGMGSGRLPGFAEKWRVEDSWVLDVVKLARDGLIGGARVNFGNLTWNEVRTGKKVASVGFCFVPATDDRPPCLTLNYTITGRDGTQAPVKLPITLTSTPCHFGGVRWWFRCPLIVNSQPCERRARKLYLPPNSPYFGCRECHDLTYQSCRESHIWESWVRMMGSDLTPAQLRRVFRFGR